MLIWSEVSNSVLSSFSSMLYTFGLIAAKVGCEQTVCKCLSFPFSAIEHNGHQRMGPLNAICNYYYYESLCESNHVFYYILLYTVDVDNWCSNIDIDRNMDNLERGMEGYLLVISICVYNILFACSFYAWVIFNKPQLFAMSGWQAYKKNRNENFLASSNIRFKSSAIIASINT